MRLGACCDYMLGYMVKIVPQVGIGKDPVVLDVEGRYPDEVSKWAIVSMPLIRCYVDCCCKSNSEKKINNVRFWQSKEYRVKEECPKQWLNELTLIEDEELSNMNGESLGLPGSRGCTPLLFFLLHATKPPSCDTGLARSKLNN